MPRIKKIKSGKKYYYYWVKDVYKPKLRRSTTVTIRKATPEEVKKFESGELQALDDKEEEEPVKFQLKMIFDDGEEVTTDYNSHSILIKGLANRLKTIRDIEEIDGRKLKKMEIIPQY